MLRGMSLDNPSLRMPYVSHLFHSPCLYIEGREGHMGEGTITSSGGGETYTTSEGVGRLGVLDGIVSTSRYLKIGDEAFMFPNTRCGMPKGASGQWWRLEQDNIKMKKYL